jgi:hypothetical protein
MPNVKKIFFPRAKHSIVENRTSYKVHLKLTINQFSRRDLGIYMCVSTNSLGHADGTVRLYGKCLSHVLVILGNSSLQAIKM